MLTDMQRRFAEAFVANGGQNGADAARIAGCTPDRARITASEWLRHDGVLAEIRRLVQSKLSASVAFAATELEDIARDRNSKDRGIQLKAVSQLLDRGGLLLERLGRLDVYHHAAPADELPGQALANELLPELDSMGLQIVDRRKWDRYIQSLDAGAMIDVTPTAVSIEDKTSEW